MFGQFGQWVCFVVVASFQVVGRSFVICTPVLIFEIECCCIGDLGHWDVLISLVCSAVGFGGKFCFKYLNSKPSVLICEISMDGV